MTSDRKLNQKSTILKQKLRIPTSLPSTLRPKIGRMRVCVVKEENGVSCRPVLSFMADRQSHLQIWPKKRCAKAEARNDMTLKQKRGDSNQLAK